MAVKNPGTHRTHCCILHGCKYGNDECPVVSGEIRQDYTCEDCSRDGIETMEDFRDFRAGKKKTCPHCGHILEDEKNV